MQQDAEHLYENYQCYVNKPICTEQENQVKSFPLIFIWGEGGKEMCMLFMNVWIIFG
jgi:hypothetical protein